MSKIEIVGAKLVGALFCHYKFREDIGKGRHDVVTIKSERPIHDDLRDRFRALIPHMPVIMEDILPGDIEDMNSDINGFTTSDAVKEIIAKFTVTEFEIDPESGKASLVGTKSLALGNISIETMNIPFEGKYHYGLELRFHIDQLIREVEEYRAGKQAPEAVQTDMFSSENPEINDQGELVIPEKKHRGRPKKATYKAKRIIGKYEKNGEWGPYDIIHEEDAEDGDCIGIDVNDGAPIFKGGAEPLTNFQQDPKDVE